MPELVRQGEALAEAAKAELRAEIHRRRLVGADIARDLGYNPSYLSNLFGGRSGKTAVSLRLETFLALCLRLGVEPGAVLAGGGTTRYRPQTLETVQTEDIGNRLLGRDLRR